MGDRLRTPDAVADIEDGRWAYSRGGALEYCCDGSGFITSCSRSDTRPPAHPADNGFLGQPEDGVGR